MKRINMDKASKTTKMSTDFKNFIDLSPVGHFFQERGHISMHVPGLPQINFTIACFHDVSMVNVISEVNLVHFKVIIENIINRDLFHINDCINQVMGYTHSLQTTNF